VADLIRASDRPIKRENGVHDVTQGNRVIGVAARQGGRGNNFFARP
jgi:hypothetical protein